MKKHRSMGLDPPKGSEEIGRRAHQDTFHHLLAALGKQASTTGLEISKCDAHP